MRILAILSLLIFSTLSFAGETKFDNLNQLKIKEDKATKLINMVNELKPNMNHQQNFIVSLQEIKEEIGQNRDKFNQKSVENCDQKLNTLIKSIQIYLNS